MKTAVRCVFAMTSCDQEIFNHGNLRICSRRKGDMSLAGPLSHLAVITIWSPAMADQKLSHSAYTAIINAPIEKVNIADWLLHLPDAEYQRCAPPDHIAAGTTTTDDGRPMSINVEQIGDGLVIQHYVGEIMEPGHCKMVSTSDVYTKNGRTKVRVIWDLSVRPIDSEKCEYTNDVLSFTTPEMLEFLEQHGSSVEQAAAARQAASSDHNRRETPLFAKSIERKALSGKFPTGTSKS